MPKARRKTTTSPVPTPCCPCTTCGAQTCKEEHGCAYLKNGATGEHDRVCYACAVKAWQCPVQFVFEHGLPAWVEPHMRRREVLERLQSWFRNGERCTVNFVNRATTETVEWQYRWQQWERTRPPRKPYSYRGYCGAGTVVIIVDALGIETPESVEWLTYHELAHHEQQTAAHMSDAAWNHENKNEGRSGYEWEDDAGHEADSEERHVNRVATAYMGGKEYARPWWRPRVNAVLAGQPLPDA